jgi:hypothetical protein
MDIAPSGVCSCLYTGITERINALIRYMNMYDNGTMEVIPKLLKQDYKTIEEAMEFYAKHCVLSYAYLEQAFEPVKEQYNRIISEISSEKGEYE